MGALRTKLGDAGKTFGQVLRNPQVRRLEASWAAAMVSGWGFSVAIVVYTFDKGGAGLVGVALAIKIIPAALAAPFISTLADRISRRRVLGTALFGSATGTTLFAILVIVDAPVAVVIAFGTVNTVCATALQPAVASLLPQLCEQADELTAANVVNSTIESLAIFVGPAIGGLVVGLSSPQALGFVATAGFGLAAAFALAVAEPSRRSGNEETEGGDSAPGILAEVGEGFRVVRSNPGLRTIVGLMVAQTFVDGALAVLVAVAAFDLLEIGQSGVGFLNSALGVGALLGSGLAAGMVGGRLAPSFSVGMALWGAPLAILVLLPFPVAAFTLFAVIGIGNILIDVAGLTLLQRVAPEDVLARVFGVLEATILVSVALGGLLTPVLLDLAGEDATFLAVGLFLPLLAAVGYPRLRRVDIDAAVPAEAIEILRSIPLFSPLGPITLEELATRCGRRRIAAGEPIFEQGESGDRFYAIASGEVRVLVDGSEARIEGPGDYFGEIALIRDVRRTASVIAMSDLDLLYLERDDFLSAVSGHAESRAEADTVVSARLAHMRPSLGTP